MMVMTCDDGDDSLVMVMTRAMMVMTRDDGDDLR
jgi:hypothetical protein